MSKEKSPFPCKTGYPLPLGATPLAEGLNFSLFSRHATAVTLVIAIPALAGGEDEYVELALDAEHNKTGDLWHILLETKRHDIVYGYKLSGPTGNDVQGAWFNGADILIDPYCHKLVPRAWGQSAHYGKAPCCQIPCHDFDWQGDRPLKIPLEDSVIYELHVRGFTQNSNSGVKHPGTYRGIIEKIPYLKRLGITAIELMPVTEFDENANTFIHPTTQLPLKNFWGYNPISFFALKSGYAADPHDHMNEFKEMVRALHQAGIEVILDMVYNHTGEGGYDKPSLSFRGIDNPIYYLLDQADQSYLNFSGCGNTFNCNHPVVRSLIRESLRYWVMEMHIDGFRFDLASILGRDKQGHLLANPPMIELIAEDPLLRDTKIIAEAWDAAGLYQVGSFSTDNRWAEWNGKFRDDVRMFHASYDNAVTNLATRIAGSSDLYQSSSRNPWNSINFITSHDGYTLYDLVSYQKKHNEANGEQNRDGDNHNLSWNSGCEGVTNDKTIEKLRLRRMRSMALTLLLSQGVPMLTAGDEFGRTQQGNNNAWCQDNTTSWLDWSLVEQNDNLLHFFRQCIHLRRTHSIFRRFHFFDSTGQGKNNQGDISWQSLLPGTQDWSSSCRTLGFLLHGSASRDTTDDDFFIMLNGSRDSDAIFTIPEIPGSATSRHWHKIIDTAAEGPQTFVATSRAKRVRAGQQLTVQRMATVVLQSLERNTSQKQ